MLVQELEACFFLRVTVHSIFLSLLPSASFHCVLLLVAHGLRLHLGAGKYSECFGHQPQFSIKFNYYNLLVYGVGQMHIDSVKHQSQY